MCEVPLYSDASRLSASAGLGPVYSYPSIGDGDTLDPGEVLGRSQGPAVGRMSPLGT